jgi:hypothetical protein
MPGLVVGGAQPNNIQWAVIAVVVGVDTFFASTNLARLWDQLPGSDSPANHVVAAHPSLVCLAPFTADFCFYCLLCGIL